MLDMNVEETKFYSIRKISLLKEDIVRGDGRGPLERLSFRVEEILEGYRPGHCFGRGFSVFMNNKRDFRFLGIPLQNGYIHEVVPVGEVQIRDVNWVGYLLQRFSPLAASSSNLASMSMTDREFVENYWDGQPTNAPMWEFVSETAIVRNVDERPSRVPPMREEM